MEKIKKVELMESGNWFSNLYTATLFIATSTLSVIGASVNFTGIGQSADFVWMVILKILPAAAFYYAYGDKVKRDFIKARTALKLKIKEMQEVKWYKSRQVWASIIGIIVVPGLEYLAGIHWINGVIAAAFIMFVTTVFQATSNDKPIFDIGVNVPKGYLIVVNIIVGLATFMQWLVEHNQHPDGVAGHLWFDPVKLSAAVFFLNLIKRAFLTLPLAAGLFSNKSKKEK